MHTSEWRTLAERLAFCGWWTQVVCVLYVSIVCPRMPTTAIASSWESWEIKGLDKSCSWKIADLGLSGFVLYYWVHSTVHTHYEQMLLSMVSIVPIRHHVALLVTNLLELYIGNSSGGQLAEGDMLEPSMSCSIANCIYIYTYCSFVLHGKKPFVICHMGLGLKHFFGRWQMTSDWLLGVTGFAMPHTKACVDWCAQEEWLSKFWRQLKGNFQLSWTLQ